MPRAKKPPAPPPRREPGTGSVAWSETRQRWLARLPKQDGRPKRESWHRSRDEAEAWIVRALKRDAESFDPAKPLGMYLNYWYELRQGKWKPQTARRYRYELAAIGDLGLVPLYRLRGDRVAAAQKALLDRGVTNRYAYNVLSLLRRALNDAVKWKIIEENPVDAETLPEPEHKVAKAWDTDELRAVLAAIVGHRFEAVYLLILWGGLRIGEVVTLRWNQIGDDGAVAFDQAEWTQERGRPIGETKRERDRETQIPVHVVKRLRELRAAGPAPMNWPARPKRDVAYVYVAQRPDGNRWTPRQIRDDWNALVGTVKVSEDGELVKQLRPHGGRRTFGTAHMVAGTPLADLAKLMGHSSPATTAASYLATSKARRQEAAGRMAALLGTDPGTSNGQADGQRPG